jgi:NADPH:quinone reductase-like Zn-dependent oxidoreductase
MQIRAAVLEDFGQPLVVQDIDLAEPRQGEVLVRLEACGVCHTDLYAASGADPTGYAPCVLGHEGAGVVERVGPGVTLVEPGDHVVTLFAPSGLVGAFASVRERLGATRRQQKPAVMEGAGQIVQQLGVDERRPSIIAPLRRGFMRRAADWTV